MSGRRRRRRANIDPTLVECIVFAWNYYYQSYLDRRFLIGQEQSDIGRN